MGTEEGADARATSKRASGKGGGRNRSGGGSAKVRRAAARLAAVQALYQIDITGTPVETVVGEFVKHRLGGEVDEAEGARFVAADPQLFADIVRGAAYRQDDVDQMISDALAGRGPIDRVEALLRAVLRAGAYELLAHADVHPRIIIGAYLDVTHAFFGGREPSLVNGVLDRLARTLRPDELANPDPTRE
ncbi:MAG TPA: transcription antitermination factor NusB [Azospirillaceae bacterium]|nr:transcription antitermination factor NusB [Azospirillaceae bacterium]